MKIPTPAQYHGSYLSPPPPHLWYRVEQIVRLTWKKQFNQILIESLGVSEPHEIPSLFDSMSMTMPTKLLNVKQPHEQVWLGEVAKLDTCVTPIKQPDQQ